MESHSQPRAPEGAPKERTYLLVFGLLALLTAIEVGITYLPVPRIPILVPLALVKAALVALFYMHLRYDRRLFAILFGFGLVAGLGLIISFVLLFAPALLSR